MGSIEAESPMTYGTFDVPIDVDGPGDPWSRPYMRPPPPSKIVKRRYPLYDFRKDVIDNNVEQDSDASYSKAADYLSQKGFTVLKHNSVLHAEPYGKFEDFQNEDLVKKLYYPETETLLKKVTGCKTVIITNSLVRGASTDSSFKPTVQVTYANARESVHIGTPLAPTRVPHVDSTPFGARNAIRNTLESVRATADAAGIFAREDDICEQYGNGVRPTDKASNETIAAHYNDASEDRGTGRGRYALFTIWRPLRTVTRDPLAMLPQKDLARDTEILAWPYLNRNPGPHGDWLRELEMLKIRKEVFEQSPEASKLLEGSHDLKWYWVPNQAIDEVLVVKFMDTASHGQDAKEAAGAYHGSPDIGDAAFGGPRESIEMRATAFW